MVPVTHDTKKVFNVMKYLVDTVGGLDVSLLPDLEQALLPFDSRCGYPPVYYSILDMYYYGYIDKLPRQVLNMMKEIRRVYMIDGATVDIYSPVTYDMRVAVAVSTHILTRPISENDAAYITNVFKQLPDEFKANTEILQEFVLANPHLICYVSQELRENKVFMFPLVSKHWVLYQYLPDCLKRDREIILAVMKLRYLPDHLLDDIDILSKLTHYILYGQ